VITAYGIPYFRISGLSPTGSPDFEIDAKVPAGATRDQVKLMWQHLLAERFRFAAHSEQKEMPAFELAVVKGGFKLKQAKEPQAPGAAETTPFHFPEGRMTDRDLWNLAAASIGPAFGLGKARWMASRAPIGSLSSMLERQLQRQVTDSTDLKGKYDFKLWWSASANSDDSADGPTIFRALQEQLGLSLQPQKKARVEILVVDHVERMPTEN
jgi:uncharacterized protein (TIGR03435 family)